LRLYDDEAVGALFHIELTRHAFSIVVSFENNLFRRSAFLLSLLMSFSKSA
jgi:hypothetical protein